jgi:2-polyprenyl-3-methyl-5-hydroxy-6-metoxy-1,4-benzoquinol methylase
MTMTETTYFEHLRPEMVRYLPADAKRILDVGCGTGAFSASIKKDREVVIWGMEIDAKAAEEAARRLDRVLTGDAASNLAELPDAFFDCVFCNDVLEHLVEPEEFLRGLLGKLTANGRIIASIPNVRFFQHLRGLVLHGRWDYVDEGILDRTHLRFFTRSSILDTFQRCGYRIVTMDGIHPTGSLYFHLFNILTFGRFSEMRFLQFACVALPR